MFIGPWDQGGDWDDSGIGGVHRWLQRVWTLVETDRGRQTADSGGQPSAVVGQPSAVEKELRRKTHQTIKRVTEDLEAFRFNTMVAALMEYTNYLQKAREQVPSASDAWREAIDALVLMIAPSAPHLAEELWQKMGRAYSVHQQAWPAWDEKIAAEEVFTLAVQVNGKVRDRVTLPVGVSEAEAKDAALKAENVQKYLQGKPPKQVIYVPGRLVNVVV
jgi:leucyl-tRNA synthetase